MGKYSVFGRLFLEELHLFLEHWDIEATVSVKIEKEKSSSSMASVISFVSLVLLLQCLTISLIKNINSLNYLRVVYFLSG